MFRYTTILFILIAAITQSWAVQPYQPIQRDPVLEPWRWRSFPELKGFGLQCMAEAQDKTMWFGGDNGVRRYDGITWTEYGEADGIYGMPIKVLCATKDGSIYAGTHLGISRFKEGKWTRIFPREGSFRWGVVDLVETSDSNLWAATFWGALQISNNEPTLYTTSGMAQTVKMWEPSIKLFIVPDAAAPSKPWVDGTGIQIFSSGQRDEKPKVIWNLAPDSPAKSTDLQIGDQILSIEGLTYTSQEHLNGVNAKPLKLTIQRLGAADSLEMIVTRDQVKGEYRNFSIASVYEDRANSNHIWFGLRSGEILLCDFHRAKTDDPLAWKLYTESDGLFIAGGRQILHNTRRRVFRSKDGIIWGISSIDFNRVNRFDGQTWTHFSLSEVMGESTTSNITALQETRDGTFWLSGLGTLYAYRDKKWTMYKQEDIKFPNRAGMHLLATSDGVLWVSGDGEEAARLDLDTSRWTTYENLEYSGASTDGVLWFISRNPDQRGLVSYDGKDWLHYSVEDGVMDFPIRVLENKIKEIWAIGNHNRTSAIARLNGQKWNLRTFPKHAWTISRTGILDAQDGTLWLGGQVVRTDLGHLGGVLQYDGKTWRHHTPQDGAPRSFTHGMGQTPDGTIWTGGTSGVHRYDGESWSAVVEPQAFVNSKIGNIYSAPNGDLWVLTREYGIFRYREGNWVQYDTRHGLADIRPLYALQTKDRTFWVTTYEGTSRFDGQSWTTQALPHKLTGHLLQSPDDALWINGTARERSTIRYQMDEEPPETEITLEVDEVAQPGNIAITWKGADPWKDTPTEELQFAWRLDDEEWTAFSKETQKTLLSLPSGTHRFQVKARDRDFNEDPTPASVTFTVIPPVYQQAWFIGLMAIFLSAITFQTVRVIRRDRRLIITNEALSDANKKLFQVNTDLQQKTEDLETANQTIVEQTERKSTFLAQMSHEIRTPITSIKGYIDNMLDGIGGTLNERQEHNLTRVSQNSDHLLGLVNSLLDLSKIEAGRMDVAVQTFNIKNLIIACCDTVHPLIKPNVSLTHQIDDSIGDAQTDEGRIRQIIINLLSNALKFTDSGHVSVHASKENDHLTIAVSDTGTGIPPDALDHIFEEFQQVTGSDPQHKGTGLGLPITKGFAELLGGTIDVQSEVGKGSTFTIRIPMVYQAN